MSYPHSLAVTSTALIAGGIGPTHSDSRTASFPRLRHILNDVPACAGRVGRVVHSCAGMCLGTRLGGCGIVFLKGTHCLHKTRGRREGRGSGWLSQLSSAICRPACGQGPLGVGLGARLPSQLRNNAWATGRGGHSLYDGQPDPWSGRCGSEDGWDGRWNRNFSLRHMQDNKGLVSHCKQCIESSSLLTPVRARAPYSRPHRDHVCEVGRPQHPRARSRLHRPKFFSYSKVPCTQNWGNGRAE